MKCIKINKTSATRTISPALSLFSLLTLDQEISCEWAIFISEGSLVSLMSEIATHAEQQ